MFNYLVHPNEVHEIQVHHFAHNTLTKLMNIISNLFHETESSHLYLSLNLIDANDLLIRVLAHELRRVASQHGHISACIAIIVADGVAQEFVENTIRTILNRDRVHVFVDAEKANFWLQLERNKTHTD